MLYVGAVEGSALSVAVCVAGNASVASVCMCGCAHTRVHPWHTHVALLLIQPADGKAAAVSIGLGQRPPGLQAHWVELQWPGRRNPRARRAAGGRGCS